MANRLRQKRASSLREKTMLAIAVIAIVFVADSSSQPDSQQPIQIGASAPPSVTRKISLNQQQIPVDFIGDGTKWWYVQFETIPPGNDISVKGNPTGYDDIKSIKTGVWYPFKQRLSLNLSISKTNFESTDSSRWYFHLAFAKNLPSNATPKDARDHALDQSKLEIEKENRFIEVFWRSDQSITISPAQLTFEIVDNKITPAEQGFEIKGSDSSWRFVRFRNISQDIQLIIKDMDNNKEETTAILGLELRKEGLDSIWYAFRGTLKLKVRWVVREPNDLTLEIEEGQSKPGVEMEDKKDAEDVIAAKTVKATASSHKIQLSLKRGVEIPTNWNLYLKIGIVAVVGIILIFLAYMLFYRNPQSKIPDSISPQKIKANRDTKTFAQGSNGRLSRILSLLKGIKKEHAEENPLPADGSGRDDKPLLVDQLSQTGHQGQGSNQSNTSSTNTNQTPKQSLTEDELKGIIRNIVDETLRALPQPLKEELKTIVTTEVKKLRDELTTKQDAIIQRIDALEEQIKQDQSDAKLLLDAIASVGNQIENAERFKETMEQISKEHEERDRLYAKLLSSLFKDNFDFIQPRISELAIWKAGYLFQAQKETSVAQQINFGGSLQKGSEPFYEESRGEIRSAGSLDDLRSRARDIYDTLKRVAEKVALLAPGQFDNKMAGFVDEAKEIADSLESVRTQLQSGKLELRPRIRFSAHKNAHYSFIEKLGIAIKHELDKVQDPESYFRRELGRLATGNIITVSEICDKITDGPGGNPELERELQSLFKSADLRSILPRADDPFAPAEQNLIQVVFSNSDQSQNIAKVVSRGFAYNDGKKEVLLRKAGVKVYR